MRGVHYTLGAALMAALLGMSVFGSTGHMADPGAARGVLITVFLMMQYQRFTMRALLTRHVVWSSLAGGMLGASLGRAFWRFPSSEWPEEIMEAVLAALFCSLLMSASFYFLTLRRGRMP